jgi:hypothetical protein
MRLILEPEPVLTAGAQYWFGENGDIFDTYGNPADKTQVTAGVWARIRASELLVPATALDSDASAVFFEEVSYDAETDQLRWVPRRGRSVLALAGVR